MEASAVKVLLIDDESDLLDVSRQFLELDPKFSPDTATSAADALKLIRLQDYDVIVSDYQMPGQDGIQLLKEIRGTGNKVPFILFTGKGREEVAIEALNAGADYYLQKGGDPRSQFAELQNMIVKSIQKHRMELDLRENEEKFKNIFNSANDSIHILNLDGRILEINNIGCDWLGYTKQEMLQKNVKDIDAKEYSRQVPARMKEVMERGYALFETEWVTRSGKVIPVEVSARKINYAGRPAILTVARDVTERKRNGQTLIENEVKFRTVADFTYDWEYWIAPDGHIIHCSPSCERITGYSSDELSHDPSLILEMVHPEDKPLLDKHLEMEMGAEPFEFDFRIITRKGEIRWISHACQAVFDDRERHLGRRVGNRDITERKRAEEAMRNIQAQLRIAMDLAKLVHWEYDVDKDLFTFDDQFYALYGSNEEKEGGQLMSSATYANRFVPPEEAGLVAEEIGKAISTTDANYVGQVTHTIIRSDGERRIINARFGVVKDAAGRTVKTFGANQDITERKRAEEELRESEKRYRLLVESAAEVILVLQDGMIRLVNPIAVAMTGFSEQEIMSKPFPSFIHPDDRAMVVERHQRRLRDEAVPARYTFRLLAKDGSTKWVEVSAITIEWDGRPATLNFLTDITERKRAEEELRRTSDRLSLATRAGGVGVWELDIINNKLTWDDQMFRLYGVQKEHFGGAYETWRACVLPEDLQQGDAEVQMALRGEKEFDTEFRVLWPDGTIRHIHALALVQRDASGQPLCLVGTNQDITERKQAEEKLRASEEKFRATIEQSSDGIIIIDADARIIEWSATQTKIFGYTRDEMLGRPIWEFQYAIFPEEQRTPIFLDRMKATMIDYFTHPDLSSALNFEYDVQSKDGCRKAVQMSMFSVATSGAKLYCAITHEITERKQAEEALRQSDERFQLANRVTFNAIWDWNLQTDAIWWNENFQTLFGYRAEEVEETIESWTNRIHPEDLDRVTVGIHAAIDSGRQSWSDQYRFRCKDGTYAEVDDRGYVVREASGKPVRMIGAMQDITERKRVEEVRIEREEYLRAILQTTADGFWMLDAEGNVTDVNETYCRMSGYTRDELLRLCISDLDAVEERAETAARVNRIIENGSEIFETRHRRKNGSVFDVEVSTTYMATDGGRLVCFCRDITERKRAEEALGESERKYRLLAENINDVIWTLNIATQRFTYISPSGEKLSGFTAEEAMRQTLKEVLHPDSYTEIIRLLPIWIEQFRRGGKVKMSRRDIIRQNRKDGSWVTVEIVSTLLQDDKGEITEVVGVSRDVTDRVSAEEALREANRKLNLLSSITGHDIDNQIMVVNGLLELCKLRGNDPDLAPYFDKMSRAAANVQEQIAFTKDYQELGIHAPAWVSVGRQTNDAFAMLHPPGVALEDGTDGAWRSWPICCWRRCPTI